MNMLMCVLYLMYTHTHTHTNTNIKSLEQNMNFLGNTSHKHQHFFHGIFPRIGNNEIKAQISIWEDNLLFTFSEF
jgi:hypothetical protein